MTIKRVSAISIIFSIAAVFLAPPNASCAGEVKHYQIQSKIPGETDRRALSVYLPEGYSTSGASYPVLYLLHGNDGNDLTFLAIAGHSTGGYHSLYMTLAHSEVFSIAGGLSSDLGYLKMQLGELVKAHDQKTYPIRFWLYAGRNDQYGVTQPNRDFVKALKENGLPTEYTEDDGDHIDKVAQRLGEFIEFFSKFLKW